MAGPGRLACADFSSTCGRLQPELIRGHHEPLPRPFTLRCPVPASSGRVATPPAVPAVPMVPEQGSTSMMWQSLIFSHMYLMQDLLLFHI